MADLVAVARDRELAIQQREVLDDRFDQRFELELHQDSRIVACYRDGELVSVALELQDTDLAAVEAIAEALFARSVVSGDQIRFSHAPITADWSVGARGRYHGAEVSRASFTIDRRD